MTLERGSDVRALSAAHFDMLRPDRLFELPNETTSAKNLSEPQPFYHLSRIELGFLPVLRIPKLVKKCTTSEAAPLHTVLDFAISR